MKRAWKPVWNSSARSSLPQSPPLRSPAPHSHSAPQGAMNITWEPTPTPPKLSLDASRVRGDDNRHPNSWEKRLLKGLALKLGLEEREPFFPHLLKEEEYGIIILCGSDEGLGRVGLCPNCLLSLGHPKSLLWVLLMSPTLQREQAQRGETLSLGCTAKTWIQPGIYS